MSNTSNLDGLLERVAKRSWEVFAKRPEVFLLGTLVYVVLSGVTLGIMAGALTVGFLKITRKRLADQPAAVGDLFEGMGAFVTALIACVIIVIGVIVGSILLLLPGLAVAWACMFTLHFIAFEDAGAFDAIGRSFNLVKANAGVTIVIFLVMAIFSGIGGSVPFGFLLTMPLCMLASVLVFDELRGREASLTKSP